MDLKAHAVEVEQGPKDCNVTVMKVSTEESNKKDNMKNGKKKKKTLSLKGNYNKREKGDINGTT